MQIDHTTQENQRKLSTWFADEFRPAVLATSLISGVLVYIFEIIVVISFAALIFSGDLAHQLPKALGFIILGDAILVVMITLLSSYGGTIGVSQDAPVAIMGLVAMQIVAALPAAAAAQQFSTVVMVIVVTTLMTGAIFTVLGMFKLGSLARYFPFPVMGGFLAGTGWLLARGGVETMVSIPFGSQWLDAQVLLRWLPGTLLGVLILILLARFRQTVTLPVILALSILSFYIVAGLMDVSPAQLDAGGWLVGSLPSGGLAQLPLSGDILSQVNWGVLWRQIPNIAPVAIISVIGLLLNSGGLELVIKRDLKLNRELVAAGFGNLAAGLMGGLTGYHAISLSTLTHKMSGGKRLVGLFAGLLLGLTIFLGTSVIRYIPNMILGAVLVYLGVALLFEWVYEAWFKFPRIDFVIIVSILGVIMLSSFMNGVIFGLVLAIIMFVVSYSNISVIKHTLTGEEYYSRVTRSSKQRQLLEARGDQITILKLQGFIFFGTANSIVNTLRELALPKSPHTRIISCSISHR
jgi:sulfate permease, SulP family